MPKTESRATRDKRQTDEVEVNQARLRTSIAETGRLVEETDNILRWHREERSEADEQKPIFSTSS